MVQVVFGFSGKTGAEGATTTTARVTAIPKGKANLNDMIASEIGTELVAAKWWVGARQAELVPPY